MQANQALHRLRSVPGPALIVLVLACVGSVGASAQSEEPTTPSRVVHVHTLKHQPAVEAVSLIHPVLSEHGAVELRPGGNTLVIRDSPEVVEQIVRLLESFDHPSNRVRLEIKIVRAGLDGSPIEGQRELQETLARRLQELLRYEHFRLLADASLVVREGEEISHRLGDDYEVGFRMGTLLADRRIKLHGFQMAHRLGNPEPKELIHTNLNLWLAKPMILGLARAESSNEALMVILTCTLDRSAGSSDE